MKITKKFLPVLMAAILAMPVLPVSAAEKSWDLGKNDPKEVVATYSNGVLTLSNQYTYDETLGVEELPNPGLMADNACGEITAWLASNEISGVTVVVGSGVQTVGASSFAGCSAIDEVQINSADFKEIKQNAFANSGVRTATIGKGEIGSNAFQSTPLETLTLTDVTSIGDGAFQGTKLKSVSLPDSLKSIGQYAFSDTAVENIVGGKNVASVGSNAFSGGKAIKIPDTASDAIKSYDWTGSGYTDITQGDAKQVVVTFNVNGGDAIPAKTIASGSAFTAPAPHYASMTFDGWFTDSNFQTPWVDGTALEANLTLYAKWHGDTVTLTMNLQNNTSNQTQSVKYGAKATKPADPTPTDDKKVFGGWFTDAGCTTAFSWDTALFSDTTIYAKWADAKFYTVKFDVDGGTKIDDQSIKAGSLVATPTDPTKQDYTFDGWYKDKKFKTKWDFEKDKISGDTTIYARFLSNKVTVKFETNGGSAVSAVTVDRNAKLSGVTAPTKDNAEFLGWFKNSELTEEFNPETDTVKDNMTLYAKWNQTAFTVKWESNGGSSVEPTTANPNALIAKPADPTKAGYYLVGWCKDSDLKNQWNFDSDKVTADMTLYALWAVGDPATVDGAQPGVTNTGAKAPQTGDASTPLFHLFASLSSVAGAGGVGGYAWTKRRRRLL